MTKQEKQLLLTDLCARLRYGVKVQVCNVTEYTPVLKGILGDDLFLQFDYIAKPIKNGDSTYNLIEDNIKPYLRPMSSMTEEEREELSDYLCEQVMSNKIGITIPPNPTQGKGIPFIWMDDCLNWLDKKMFDYRGLIEKGLALEAPEDMYK